MKTRFTLLSSKLPDRPDPSVDHYLLVPRYTVGVRILCCELIATSDGASVNAVTLRTDVQLVKQLDCDCLAIPTEPKLVEPLLSLLGRRAGNFYAARDG